MNNLQEINQEEIFSIIVRNVLQYAVGKLTGPVDGKGTGQILLPRDIEVAIEFRKRLQGNDQASDLNTPYVRLGYPPDLAALTDAERERFEGALATDPDFQIEVQAIVDGATPEAEMSETTSKEVTIHRKSSTTLMSPEVVDELKPTPQRRKAREYSLLQQ